MTQSKVHHCYEQEMVAMGKLEPRKPKCRCRKMVDYKTANELVSVGEAMWFVVARERGMQTVTCPMCDKRELSKSCDVCKGTGVTQVPVVWDTYTTDIILITHRTKTNKISTPRVATIEEEHIYRAYGAALTKTKHRQWVGDGEAARARIEEYGRLILDARMFVGPSRCAHSEFHPVTKERIFCTRCLKQGGEGSISQIKPEPINDIETAQGRDYDYGRPLIYIPGLSNYVSVAGSLDIIPVNAKLNTGLSIAEWGGKSE